MDEKEWENILNVNWIIEDLINTLPIEREKPCGTDDILWIKKFNEGLTDHHLSDRTDQAGKDDLIKLQVTQRSAVDVSLLPDQNNNADYVDTETDVSMQKSKTDKTKKSSDESNDEKLSIRSRSPEKKNIFKDVEKDKLSKLSWVLRYLITENKILDSKYLKDIEYVWMSLRPDRTDGKTSSVMETIIEEEFYIVSKNCLKQMRNIEIQNKDAFKGILQAKLILNITWMLSDSSQKFCRQIIQNLEILNNLRHMMEYIVSIDQFEDDKDMKNTIKAFLGILHNVCRHCSDSRECLRNSSFLSVLLRLSKTKIAMIRAKCLIVMSYIVNDSEIHIISTDNNVLTFILDILKNAQSSCDHMSYKYGMNVLEILQSINNLLASEQNKEKLMSLKILEIYLDIISKKFSDEEIMLSVHGIWKLSFHNSNKAKMKKSAELIEVLGYLQYSEIDDVKHAARGALWEISHYVESPDRNRNSVQLEAECQHIMISYQWDSQPVMLKVKDRLKEAGYKVWMDVEHMTGSTLEAMALAVEKSSVVLIAMSQKYKDSPSCRSEAEYTYKLRKSFIPLQLQHQYVPDGWLGMLIGTRLYFDISNEEKINQQMGNIMKELGNRGKICVHHDYVEGKFSMPETQSYLDWSPDDVVIWMTKNTINNVPEEMRRLDGSLLKELVTIQDRAPENFYNLVQTGFGLDVIDFLKFSKMLRQLNR